MRKETFVDRHKSLNIQQAEIERKWRVYLREQEEMKLMFEAAQAMKSTSTSTPGAGGGGGDGFDNNTVNNYVEDDYVEDYLL